MIKTIIITSLLWVGIFIIYSIVENENRNKEILQKIQNEVIKQEAGLDAEVSKLFLIELNRSSSNDNFDFYGKYVAGCTKEVVIKGHYSNYDIVKHLTKTKTIK